MKLIMCVHIKQTVYPVVEGEQYLVALTIQRDVDVYPDRMVLEYATSDLTARGVDPEFYNYCQSLPVNHRAQIGCGDYEQTVGRVVLESGIPEGSFEIRIMDDRCYERFSKFIQVRPPVLLGVFSGSC